MSFNSHKELANDLENLNAQSKTTLRNFGYINAEEIVKALEIFNNTDELISFVVENHYDQVKEAIQEQAS